MIYQVKDISTISGVTVRTIHHYDDIGLLNPHSVTEAGYRIYSDTELERLQQIMFFRELDFSLSDIKRILDDPAFDSEEALTMHRRLLAEKRRRLGSLIKTIDRALDKAGATSKSRGTKEMFAGFDESKMQEYRDEAKQRWGNSIAWKESETRTASYSKGDWDSIRGEIAQINQTIVSRMEFGVSDEQVQLAVASWHSLINERFYTCTTEVFSGLGEMYVSDARFSAHYEEISPGLAEFLRDAIREYVKRS